MNSRVDLPTPALPQGLRNAEEVYARAFFEGLQPDPDLTVWEWADKFRKLPQETSAEPGDWRTARVPYAREIMAELSVSSPVNEVVLMAGTQVAKTELGNNFIGSIIDQTPGPAMMVLPTSNTGKRSSKTRIAKMIESTPSIKAKVGDARSRDASNTASLKEFPGGLLVIAGANSAAELKSTPIRFLFLDELDEYPDDVDGQGPAEELAEKRTDTFALRRKVYKASTPTDLTTSKINKAYKRSDQRKYHVPCPHCQAEQVLRWENMRWEVRHAFELRCPECAAVSDLPHACATVPGEAAGDAGGGAPASNNECGAGGELAPGSGHSSGDQVTGASGSGTHIAGDGVPWATGPIAGSGVPVPDGAAAAIAPIVHTCPHCQASVIADENTVVERLTDDVLWAKYECGSCAELIDEYHKTEMLARGRWIKQNPTSRIAGFHLPALYSPLGWFSWLSAVELRLKADKDPTKKLEALFVNTVLGEAYSNRGVQLQPDKLKLRAEPYKLRSVPMGALMLAAGADVQANRLEVSVYGFGRGEEMWLVAHEVIYGDPLQGDVWASLDDFLGLTFMHESRNPMRILASGVDTGYLTQACYAYCRHRAHRGIFALKGVPLPGKSVIGRPKKQDIDWAGEIIKDGVELFQVGVDTAKTILQARLGLQLAGPGYVHFPLGLPDEFYKGLTAERYVRRWVKGYERMSWEKDAGVRNEPLDCMNYAYAAAVKAGLTRADWDKLEAYFKMTGDLFVAAEQKAAAAVSVTRSGPGGAPAQGNQPAPAPAPAKTALLPAQAPKKPVQTSAQPSKPAKAVPGGFFNGRRMRSRGVS